jgi:DNA polymerase-3 subunit beta
MKVICNTDDIARAVGTVSKIVNPHIAVPVLANLLLTAEEGRVRVRATDLEITMQNQFDAEVQESGSVTVPAKLFTSYLGNSPKGPVLIEADDTKARVKIQRAVCDFNTLPADEFPPLPKEQHNESFTMPGASLRRLLDQTIFAASTEESRGAVLCGTLVEVDGKTLRAVATDGYRLAISQLALESKHPEPLRFIVPSRALSEASRNVDSGKAVTITTLGKSRNQLSIQSDDLVITTRLVDGQYPNYEQIIPKTDPTTSVSASTADVVAALKRAELMTADRANQVRLEIGNGKLKITATSDITGNALEEIDVEHHGDDLQISFNARFLRDILDHIDDAQTLMRFGGPVAPTVMMPASTQDQRYLIMPLRA